MAAIHATVPQLVFLHNGIPVFDHIVVRILITIVELPLLLYGALTIRAAQRIWSLILRE